MRPLGWIDKHNNHYILLPSRYHQELKGNVASGKLTIANIKLSDCHIKNTSMRKTRHPFGEDCGFNNKGLLHLI
jgi:hypothetical protein